MKPLHKKIIAAAAAAFILFTAYYGSYLPMKKSQALISALRELRRVRTLDEFKETVSVPLNLRSPVGREEVARNIANLVLSTVQKVDDIGTITELVDFIDAYYEPLTGRGHGVSFGQDLYVLGALHEIAFVKTKQVRFLEASKKYYELGVELGPERPQVLYGMFDICRIENNVECVKKIGGQILDQWPNDERTRAFFGEFLIKAAGGGS